MSSYCDIAPGHPVHAYYHDHEYGFEARDESVLMERLALEINQAGLSWELMLRKRENFRRAFAGFEVDRVAAFDAADRERLLGDAGIIRNRLKVDAVIHNAGVVRALRDSHGGLANWLDAHHPRPKADWVRLFRKTFRFTGGEITGEFLMSTGWLPGAHREDCPVQKRILSTRPPWVRSPA